MPDQQPKKDFAPAQSAFQDRRFNAPRSKLEKFMLRYGPTERQNGLTTFLLGPIALLLVAFLANLSLPAISRFVGQIGQSTLDLAIAYLPEAVVQSLLVLTTTVVALSLYALRCRHLALYGMVEFFVGIGCAVYFANILYTGKLQQQSTWISELGALYIIVRGADNIYKSFTDNSGLKKWWDTRFYGKKQDK